MTQEYPEPPGHEFPFILYAATTSAATARTAVISRHDYPVCTVEYVLEGAGFLEINDFSARIGKDSIYFLTPGSRHAYWPDREDPWNKLFFVVGGPLAFSLLKAYKMEQCYHLENARNLKGYFEEMIRASSDSTGSLPSLVFHRFLQECASRQEGGNSVKPKRAPLSVMILKQTLDDAVEGVFRLEEFASVQKISQAHLIRLFKTHFHQTPYEYLLKRKMERACSLLQYSSLSIKEIAARLNFSDQYYFSNCFRRRYGVSPREYRRTL